MPDNMGNEKMTDEVKENTNVEENTVNTEEEKSVNPGNAESEKEEKVFRSDMQGSELVRAVAKRYQVSISDRAPVKNALRYFKKVELALNEDVFYKIFNPGFEERIMIEVLNGLFYGVPFSEYEEVLGKMDIRDVEVARVRNDYVSRNVDEARRKEAEEKVAKLMKEHAAEMEQQKEELTSSHKEELERTRETYDEELQVRREEVVENREMFVSFVAEQMGMMQNIIKTLQESWAQVMRLYSEDDSKDQNKNAEEIAELRLRMNKEMSDLKDDHKKQIEEKKAEFKEKEDSLKETIKEKKAEADELRKKVDSLNDQIVSLNAENERLAVWKEMHGAGASGNTPIPEEKNKNVPEHASAGKMERRNRFGAKKPKTGNGKEKDELIAIFSLKEVDDDQAAALAEAYEAGASIENIRSVAKADLSVERIRMIFDIASLSERKE